MHETIAKPFKCEGCRQELGRDHFDGSTLKKASSRGDLIVCSLCQKREREILYTIDALDATSCRCSSTWRHKENSFFFLRKNKIRVRRTDLEWLAFRPKNRRPKIQEIAYYRALSLLLEWYKDVKLAASMCSCVGQDSFYLSGRVRCGFDGCPSRKSEKGE